MIIKILKTAFQTKQNTVKPCFAFRTKQNVLSKFREPLELERCYAAIHCFLLFIKHFIYLY